MAGLPGVLSRVPSRPACPVASRTCHAWQGARDRAGPWKRAASLSPAEVGPRALGAAPQRLRGGQWIPCTAAAAGRRGAPAGGSRKPLPNAAASGPAGALPRLGEKGGAPASFSIGSPRAPASPGARPAAQDPSQGPGPVCGLLWEEGFGCVCVCVCHTFPLLILACGCSPQLLPVWQHPFASPPLAGRAHYHHPAGTEATGGVCAERPAGSPRPPSPGGSVGAGWEMGG